MLQSPLIIEGIGAICSRGRGIDSLEKSLTEGLAALQPDETGFFSHRIAKEFLTDKEALKKVKRADRFSRLAVLAAHDALCDSRVGLQGAADCATGVILSTAFGAHATIFKFLDDIIDYGETKVSPTTFAHSIHNAAASYIASALACKGPVVTMTQFNFSFLQSLLLAYAWLREKRAHRILVGITEECSPAMDYICRQKLSVARDGRMYPLDGLDKPSANPGEGSVFFLVSLNAEHKKYGSFTQVSMENKTVPADETTLSIISANGMCGSEKIYQQVLAAGTSVAAFTNVYGSLMTGSAFDCAAGALMLKHQTEYASPVFKKAAGSRWRVTEELTERTLNQVQCVSHDCEGRIGLITMNG